MDKNNLFDSETTPVQTQEKKTATSKSTIGKDEKIILDFLRKAQPHEAETIRVLADYANSTKPTVTDADKGILISYLRSNGDGNTLVRATSLCDKMARFVEPSQMGRVCSLIFTVNSELKP